MSDELHQQLHEHAASLRTLARDLLRDVHAADDVAQATLHRALSRPPQAAGSLGGWLHRTLVNFVHQWRRSERRRTTHEGAQPARTAEPAAAETLARREMLRAVTDAVLRLDEPYQTAVFLRYFEDLPPRAIAARTATSVATVKSRLARGLSMLRARLDEGHRERSWRPALACAFGLPLTPLLILPTGAMLVTSTTKMLGAAAVLCAGGLFALSLGDDPSPAAGAASTAGDRAVPGTASAQLPTERDDAVERTAAAAPVADVPWLAHPYEMQLEVLVVDELGVPIEGHRLQLAPAGCTLNHAEHQTGADGRALIAWRARAPRMDVELIDPYGTMRRVAVEHSRPAKLVLLGKAPSNRLSVWFRASRARQEAVPVLSEIPVVGKMFTTRDDGDLTMHTGLHPYAVFTDRCAQVVEQPEQLSLELTAGSYELALGESVLSESLVKSSLRFTSMDMSSGAPAEPKPAIAGTVFGEDGKPAANVPVMLLGAGPQPLQRGATDDQGRFRFDGVPQGALTVRAGGDSAGLATVPAVVTSGVTPATLQLRRGACVRGRAVDAAGKALGKARVEWRAHDGSWVDATTTGDDGSFLLANVQGSGSVSLAKSSSGHELRLATIAAVVPDSGEIVLQAAACGSTLQVEPIDAAEHPGLVFHVWQTETGLGTTLRAPDPKTTSEGGSVEASSEFAPESRRAIWSLRSLPAGFYEVELRATGGGRVQLGRHWIDGSGPCDLGRVMMPVHGEATFALADGDLPTDPAQRAFEVASLRADADVRIAPLQTDRPALLPPGGYVLAWKHADGALRFRRFTITAGQTTAVTSAQ